MLTALVLLDLPEAFDSVSRSNLLHKRSCISVAPEAVKWFDSYLTGKSRVVRMGTKTSSSLPITYDAPHGENLSPSLFSIYTNDLPSTTQSCNLDSYVGDSKAFLSFSIKDIEQAIQNLQSDLNRVAKWCSMNQLLINPGKTEFLSIGTRKLIQTILSDISLPLQGTTITPVSSAKDLGCTFRPTLFQITELVSSCVCKLVQINRAKDSFDSNTLSLVIEALNCCQ